MKIDFKKAVLIVFAASAVCLSAQESSEEAREVTMCQPTERSSPCPDDCRSGIYQKECQARVDDYDYDVYTSAGDREERCERSPSPCNKRNSERSSKSNCNNQCKRKSAASAARE